jgi:hypothetical protein
MKKLLYLICFLPAILFAATTSTSIEALKMDKRFGIGIGAGGASGVLGLEIDINLDENVSLTGGWGSGIDYSTVSLKGRYFFPGRSVSPYVGGGLARWWADSVASKDLNPGMIARHFLPDDFEPGKGFNLLLLYPVLGMQYVHPMGIEFSAELMYFFKMLNFANNAYAGFGVHWYF